jgi:hypothetical protein
MGTLGYLRIPADFYPTPPWLIRNIIPILKEEGLIKESTKFWECACGDGAITKELEAKGYSVKSSDLFDYGFGAPGIDFLTSPLVTNCDFILTNPPYGDLAEKFVRHALELTKPVKGKVAMLLRNEWDTSKSRMDLFEKHKAYRLKISTTTRPRWIEDSTGSPRHSYAWYVWDWQNDGYSASIRYVNQNANA